MSHIKIFVTHTPDKEDEIVKNDLMINIIAGAQYQTKPLPTDYIPDNTGENISKKNKAYCELTTQYWAWKNVDADYYGFCHYRRFLSLNNKKYKSNDPANRGQIHVRILNDITAHYYQLDDEKTTRDFIEQFDCILPLRQNVKRLPTPTGKKNSVLKHWEAHNRLLINKTDLRILLNIISNLYPEYEDDAKEYLASCYFWGYNSFILKKEYFFELCEFEFTILKELEKRIDPSQYNQQLFRTPAFMGEIISCIFFHHLKKRNPSLKITETQLLYFENTKKATIPAPTKNAIPIVFHIDKIPPFLFLITINSFLSKISKTQVYDIIILHWDLSENYISHFNTMFEEFDNLRITYLNYENIENTLQELNQYVLDTRLLLPWILPQYDKILCFNWNTIFNKDPADLISYDFHDSWISGCKDILMIGMANDVSDKYEKYLTDTLGIEDVIHIVDYRAFCMNLSEIRKSIQPEKIIKKISRFKKKLTISEEFNIVYQNKILFSNESWSYYYTEDLNEIRIIKQAPLVLLNNYNASKTAPVISYSPEVLWNYNASKFNLTYWNTAKSLGLYHLLLEHYTFRTRMTSSNISSDKRHSKILGGFKCIRDHGFIYTVKYAIKKI